MGAYRCQHLHSLCCRQPQRLRMSLGAGTACPLALLSTPPLPLLLRLGRARLPLWQGRLVEESDLLGGVGSANIHVAHHIIHVACHALYVDLLGGVGSPGLHQPRMRPLPLGISEAEAGATAESGDWEHPGEVSGTWVTPPGRRG
jgi:hypothetical protein